jgi:hypothetical protein
MAGLMGMTSTLVLTSRAFRHGAHKLDAHAVNVKYAVR